VVKCLTPRMLYICDSCIIALAEVPASFRASGDARALVLEVELPE
jgi:hypothetical protein